MKPGSERVKRLLEDLPDEELDEVLKPGAAAITLENFLHYLVRDLTYLLGAAEAIGNNAIVRRVQLIQQNVNLLKGSKVEKHKP